MKYLIGIKCGMTRLFLEGYSIPVTIIYIEDNRILYTEKYNNKYKITLTIGNKKNINKPELGIFNKYNINPGNIIRTFYYYNSESYYFLKNNKSLKIDNFLKSKKINITGVSKGKGFSGVIKRWNFKSQDATHGNSLSHRAPGSIGQNQSPGRVFKGKKMSGHLGCDRITIKNLIIKKFDIEKKILFVKGSIPGSNNKFVILKFIQ